MIYRINLQNFLFHALDHFTNMELVHVQYAIISARVKNSGRASNVAKINELYPLPETVAAYEEYRDKKILEKMYMDMYEEAKKERPDINWVSSSIYKTFVNPLMDHYDIWIICDQVEDIYIDALCELLRKEFAIEVIDLNELFKTGRVGSIYLDRKEVRDRAVDVRRAAAEESAKALASSHEGRVQLINMMSKKEKIKKLKEFGIRVTKDDMNDLNTLLMDAWDE